MKKFKGFSLVELVITISILSILTTIGFIGYKNFNKDSQDAKIVSDLNVLSKALNLYSFKTGFFPKIDSGVTVNLSGTLFLKQNFINDELKSKLDISLGDGSYGYSVSKNRKQYKIYSQLSTDKYLFNNQTYASDNTGNYLKFIGNNLPIIFDNNNTFITGTGNIELTNSTGNYKAFLDSSTIVSGTGNIFYDLLNQEDIKANTVYNNFSEVAKNTNVLVLYNAHRGSFKQLEVLFRKYGFNVTVDTGAVGNIDKIKSYNPKIIVCDEAYRECTDTYLTTIFNSGFYLISQGNDTDQKNSNLLIGSGVGLTSTAGTIVPFDNSNFISRMWTSTPSSFNDTRKLIYVLKSGVIPIAKDSTLGSYEAFYLEQVGKGRWFHFQTSGNPNESLFKRAVSYLLR